MKITQKKKAGLALALAILGGGVAVYAQSARAAARYRHYRNDAPAQQESQRSGDNDGGPFPERTLPDGTETGPIDHSANGG